MKGEGAQYDYGFRIYDPRVGRFLSTDPLFKSYPWYTPYQFAGNTPIQAIDLDGLEEWVVTRWYNNDGSTAKMRIFTVVDNKSKSTHVNLHFKNSSGQELAKGSKVLYLQLKTGTNAEYSKPMVGNALTPDESSLYNANKKVGPIKDETFWDLSPAYKQYETQNDEQLAKKYTEYNAHVQFKTNPPSPPRTPDVKKETNSYTSNISFWPSTAKTLGSVTSEVDGIINMVKGKSDYAITIYGNFNGTSDEDFNTKSAWAAQLAGHDTYGDLALARANKIKSLLVAKGLDASKIKAELGDPHAGMNADYKITTIQNK